MSESVSQSVTNITSRASCDAKNNNRWFGLGGCPLDRYRTDSYKWDWQWVGREISGRMDSPLKMFQPSILCAYLNIKTKIWSDEMFCVIKTGLIDRQGFSVHSLTSFWPFSATAASLNGSAAAAGGGRFAVSGQNWCMHQKNWCMQDTADVIAAS